MLYFVLRRGRKKCCSFSVAKESDGGVGLTFLECVEVLLSLCCVVLRNVA